MIHIQPQKEIVIDSFAPFNIAWLYSDPKDSILDNPSNRLRRFQTAQFFKRFPDIISEDFFEYPRDNELFEKLKKFDVIVIFNLSHTDVEICKIFKDKILIFDHCEALFGLPNEDFIMENVSAISCCSVTLARITEAYLSSRKNNPQIFVIRDSIDYDSLSFNVSLSGPIGQEDTALLMGMGGNIAYSLSRIKPLIEKAGYKIRIISEKGYEYLHDDFIIWEKNTWIKNALTCSVAVCFHDINTFPAKGNVKVTTPMAIGLPVIASPIESYMEAIEIDETGYIAISDTDWIHHLVHIRNPFMRSVMGLRARRHVLNEYSPEKIGLDYLTMIQRLQQLRKFKSIGL